jgi:hypothetical protein
LCFAAALLIVPFLTISQARAAAPSLAGIWYGEGQPDDPNIVYLDYFGSDGTFISEFRKYEGCKVIEDHVESGTWTSKGKVQYLVTTQINGKPAHFEHSYTIELLTDTQVRARLQMNGYLFVEQRIDRFQFPNCFRGV